VLGQHGRCGTGETADSTEAGTDDDASLAAARSLWQQGGGYYDSPQRERRPFAADANFWEEGMKARSTIPIAALLALAVASAAAQTKAPQQVVKPPVAQAWIDVATFAGMGMPMGAAGANPSAAMLGGMFGGQGGPNAFGNTQVGAAGRWVDVTLYTSRNPNLAEALQSVPAGTQLAPTLKLVSPTEQKGKPVRPDDESVDTPEYERPKGKMLLYWGCGENVRAGQPRVVDFATAAPADYQKFFVARRATQRGTHSAVGRPHWPSRDDTRMVPAAASLPGEHGLRGQGVPDGFRFGIPAAQDIMPPIELAQRDAGGATVLEWKSLPTARAYFIAAMGAKDGAGAEIVFWTSSEEPDTGMGLTDYQTNAAVDRWLREKVLLAPATTTCTVPKGIFGEGAMLRMIAYGAELNLAHPPRPADPKLPWEPQWAVKVRVKSVASSLLGMDMAAMTGEAEKEQAPAAGTPKKEDKPPSAVDEAMDAAKKLRGLFGR
jgi:hypothetical protein